MSSHSSLKRGMKKYSRNGSRRKSPTNLDLNAPPPTPAATEDRPTEENCVAAVGEVVRAGMAFSPIDVDEMEDDDVQMLSSPRAFLQVFLCCSE
ncbi:hypothetical protein AXF42_Ash006157 [Apostasia shenzhenica]|uniref:Uncharacterized protein n=1 Tax=Apostasia shenzhenica TaxID=1088818 RepID=A0A2I0B0E9_9ASPA|nr:hypothetical protein AXF42_Ash006157 [Apostasia shenzhenica]